MRPGHCAQAKTWLNWLACRCKISIAMAAKCPRNAAKSLSRRQSLRRRGRNETMLSRRAFAACALCAAAGFLATGWKRKRPGSSAPCSSRPTGRLTATRRSRCGSRSTPMRRSRATPIRDRNRLCRGGRNRTTIDGQGTLKLGPGDGFQVPTGTPHGGPNGPAKTVVISTYVVEKGKPLASPA